MSSDISQDQRQEPTMLTGGNTIVYVEYTATGFQWGTSNMVPLATPIDVTSGTAITFEFTRTGSTTIWYKLPPTAPAGTVLPTSNGPTTLVNPGNRSNIAFATSSGGPYSSGYVTVSDDGFDIAGGGGGDDAG